MCCDIECCLCIATEPQDLVIDLDRYLIALLDDQYISELLEDFDIITVFESEILVYVFGFLEVMISLVDPTEHEIEIAVSLIE
jgi:hypothetical protein